MKKAVLFFALGTAIGFAFNYFLADSENIALNFFYAVALGLSWGLSYYLDTPEFTLVQKLLISFSAMALLVVVGTLIFNLELAIPAILKFSTVFVAYYVVASVRSTKSLRK